MELLREITEKDIGLDDIESFAMPYLLRKAGRAVIFDHNDNIALMYVSKLGYHKLPGGGVEKGEELHTALEREALEEAGSYIEVGDEVGILIEYRNQMKLLQISYCFLAKKLPSIGEQQLTTEEIEHGFQLLWIPIDEAIQSLELDRPSDYEGKFIRLRDLAFLRKAKKIKK
ncbi:MAG: ADP-ribose pyrophosphatase [Parcubacteria group bacterium CG_4_10_14_0_2_um_filter_41_6]|nr:MAG: ADP-ribose pyrophosphatase [Parcubacteria group bacterium CG_4_10_14_0_2_um_filter_41_6]